MSEYTRCISDDELQEEIKLSKKLQGELISKVLDLFELDKSISTGVNEINKGFASAEVIKTENDLIIVALEWGQSLGIVRSENFYVLTADLNKITKENVAEYFYEYEGDIEG